MFRQKGFTLLEVMISALLIMVGLGALGVTVVAGKRFLRQAEYRSQAMSLASSKIEEYSARAYGVLNDTVVPITQEGSYNWTARVVTQNATNTKTIPYKNITVVVSYPEEDGSGGLDTKHIRLTNIVPYPKVHSKYKLTTDTTAFVPSSDPMDPDDYAVVGNTDKLSIDINYEVQKDILVMYTIAVNVNDGPLVNLTSLDTIYSTCFLDGAQVGNLTARTPIITQPTFSHMVKIDDVSSGPHPIDIRWLKDTEAGTISLREAALSIIATESD
ncbi:MAG: type II secretion system protein [Candidatus Omnitrophota bacterium]|nr:type II secretion system protein [Candidatus Omnitrophota bacterium]